MEYLKQLKPAFFFGGIILVSSLLINFGIERYGLIAAFLSFLIVAIHDLGGNYLKLTNQSRIVKKTFAMVVKPLMAIIGIASFFYVVIGQMVWYFWALAFFIALILFAVEAVAVFEEVKKS